MCTLFEQLALFVGEGEVVVEGNKINCENPASYDCSFVPMNPMRDCFCRSFFFLLTLVSEKA